MEPGSPINGEAYRNTLKKLRVAIKNRRPGLFTAGIKLLHDNARSHAACETLAIIEQFEWNPDLAK